MAKKRKSSGRRKSGGRRTTRRRSRRGGGGTRGLLPSREDQHLFLASAGIGFLEQKMKSDDSFFLNKLPAPIDALGRTGNLAVALLILGYVTKNKWARLGARAAASVTAYQLGRKGGLFTDGKAFFSVSGGGFDDDDVANAIAAQQMGALSPDGGMMPGVEFADQFAYGS